MVEVTINESAVRALSRQRRRQTGYRVMIISSGLVLLVLVAALIRYYNLLVAVEQDALTAKSQIDNAVQYRENLFPLLVEAVATFVSHEDHIFDYTNDRRAESLKPQPPTKQEIEDLVKSARTDWQGALTKIMAWAEQYPDLKTSDSFRTMMEKMSKVEQEIYERRLTCNQMVNRYTTVVRTFPENAVAFLLRFGDQSYCEVPGESEWRIDRDGATPASGAEAQ